MSATERIIEGLLRIEDLEVIIKREIYGQWVAEFFCNVGSEPSHLYTLTSDTLAGVMDKASVVTDAVNEFFNTEVVVEYPKYSSVKRR